MSDNSPNPTNSTNSIAPDPDAELEAEDIAREIRANLSSVYVDTWASLTWKGHIRIVLGERLYKKDHYRAAYVMELEEAEKLAKHILRAVERRKVKDTELSGKTPTTDDEP